MIRDWFVGEIVIIYSLQGRCGNLHVSLFNMQSVESMQLLRNVLIPIRPISLMALSKVLYRHPLLRPVKSEL